MNAPPDWTRRHFLARSAALAAAVYGSGWNARFGEAQAELAPLPGNSPQVTGAPRTPLLESNTARPLRYTPEARGFRIRNGSEFFNRPLYSPGTAFRVDAGDLPEFSLYLPGHGGNLRVGFARSSGSKWLFKAEEIVATYVSGHMLYEIRDPLLGPGVLHLQLVAQAGGAGLHLSIHARNTPADLLLIWAFGGVSGRKGHSGGDIGCEVEPVSRFFQLQPEECIKNSYILRNSTAELQSEAARLSLSFPPGARLHIADAGHWDDGWTALAERAEDSPRPLLAGSVALDASAGAESAPVHILIQQIADLPPRPADPAIAMQARLRELAALDGSLHVTTPDPFVDSAVSSLAHAADALWDEAQGAVLQGAVASRTAPGGWRGPYAMDALGQHDRMRRHLRKAIGSQNLTPLPAGQEPDAVATGPPDPGTHLTRKDALLHTFGNLSGGSADMNLVFFDALVRHLRWTGDLDFAREIWPALTRHMDWEYRNFRRAFASPGPHAPGQLAQALPLYESYACLWGSDNLQGNGSGAAYATAYNEFLNRSAATLARVLGEDPAPYEEEADLIHDALRQLLWMPESGAYAESKDLLLPQTLSTSPALHTAYHAIDSELTTPRQAWQIVIERLTALRRIPVHGPGVPEGPWFLLPSSDWLPYSWPANVLALAENMHFARALWTAGLPDDAFALFQGNLLDSTFCGLCPGNFHVTSQLDPHRGEAQRDFADAIGIASRALVEGLFGILPDLLRATLTIRPGFPSSWNQATLHHPDIDLAWRRDGLSETLEITSRLAHPVSLTLILPARTTGDPVVLSNGLAFPFAFDPDASGSPRILLTNFPAATAWKIDIRWRGKPPTGPPERITCRVGDIVPLPPGISAAQIDDPQACLQSGLAATPGHHAVFLPIHQGSCRYWLPLALEILPRETFSVDVVVSASFETFDPLDLDPLLDSQITSIFTRDYTAPRSPFCSLSLPDHLLGSWSNPDVRATIDDTGLRSAGGTLHANGTPFLTPADPAKPNIRLLSFWQPDQQRVELSLSGHARTLYLLMAGTTFPQASRTVHGAATVLYTDGTTSTLTLRNPETWWPIEQDYFFDDFLFRTSAPLPPRVDLRTGKTRTLDLASLKSQSQRMGQRIPGGAATLLRLPLHPDRTLASLTVECALYGVVLGLLAATLGR